jgi:hypothetical protein
MNALLFFGLLTGESKDLDDTKGWWPIFDEEE